MILARHLIFVLLLVAPLHGQYLYKTVLLRAAPGRLSELINLYNEIMPVYDTAGDEQPFVMRHSQGDQWDLLLLFPMQSYVEYYSSNRVEARNRAFKKVVDFDERFKQYVARHEEVFVYGARLDEVKAAFSGAQFFHVEMFVALPGKHSELLKQRQMENTYLQTLGRPQNLIFVHDQGGPWDVFTVGCYRNIKHFAESADIPEEKEEKAAKLSGFEAANKIGTYLRTLIQYHHDTLAVAVN